MYKKSSKNSKQQDVRKYIKEIAEFFSDCRIHLKNVYFKHFNFFNKNFAYKNCAVVLKWIKTI